MFSSVTMWQPLFALTLSTGIAVALLAPHYLEYSKVDANHTLGTAFFFLGLSSNFTKFKDLIGSPLGLGNISFSFFIGTFLWPALGLATTVLVLQAGLPRAVAVGFVLLAACPVGGPSTAVNTLTGGGNFECAVLMCLLSTSAAPLIFPYIYRHFLLFLLDQPLPSDAPAADVSIRAQLSPTLSTAARTGLLNFVLLNAILPLTAGVVLTAIFPPKIAANSMRRWSPVAAAAMTAMTVIVKTAEGAEAVHAAGLRLVGAVLGLHLVAMLLGFLIPAGVGAPGTTCRTAAYQASLRNSALGLVLAASLFRDNEQFALVAAPCISSIWVQNLLGAWTALLGYWCPAHCPVSDSGQPISPQAFRANSMEAILRQQTFRRISERSSINMKED